MRCPLPHPGHLGPVASTTSIRHVCGYRSMEGETLPTAKVLVDVSRPGWGLGAWWL